MRRKAILIDFLWNKGKRNRNLDNLIIWRIHYLESTIEYSGIVQKI